MTVRVDRSGVYVLNLLRAQTYYKGTMYFDSRFSNGPVTRIDDAWFEAKVDALFEVPSGPNTEGRPGRSTGVSRRLWRLIDQSPRSASYLLRGPAAPQ